MLEITTSIGPFETFTAVVNGKVVATVRKIRDQWLLTDRIGGSPFESQFIKTAKTNCKGFNSKAEAKEFIKKHYN
jgi:hypothetical protein